MIDVLSHPAPAASQARLSLIQDFRDFASRKTGRRFVDFEDLHQWSVTYPGEFWQAVWEYDRLESPTRVDFVVEGASMPGARWFEGAQVNYARHILRHADAASAAGHPAVIAEDELGAVATLDWPTLSSSVRAFAVALRRLGVGKGDRVAAYLPNRPEAIIAFLACASLGATWAICAPDMGVPAILDRFQQIEPLVLIATDGVYYSGKAIDRTTVVDELRRALPGVKTLVLVRSGFGSACIENALDFSALISTSGPAVDAFEPEWLAFDQPLWIVYSSGTTGKPKALVHGHGGVLLGAAVSRLHSDLRPSYEVGGSGERFHWFSSTGWMMWNTQVGGLLGGTTICIFDGSPTGTRESLDPGRLWRFVARNRVTFFGAGASFYSLCEKASLDLSEVGDLGRLRALGSTASPLPAAVQTGLSQRLRQAGRPGIWWFNSSGGTDICGAFCTGNIELPETPGKLQCRQLGAAVEAWNEQGQPVVGDVGELVCTKPLPNMPLFLWGDSDGSRYKEAYFDHFPGVWRHGDWLRIDADGVCEIFGRSDATINRGGHRMGTSEIYAAVEQLAEVADSLVIDVRPDGGESRLLLFVTPTSTDITGEDLDDRIRNEIRASLSPRFVPDRIVYVNAVPRTLSSKKQELPIKRLFEGWPLERVIDPETMANPECLPEYVALSQAFRTHA